MNCDKCTLYSGGSQKQSQRSERWMTVSLPNLEQEEVHAAQIVIHNGYRLPNNIIIYLVHFPAL